MAFLFICAAVCVARGEESPPVERAHADVDHVAVHDVAAYDASVPVFEPTHEWKHVLPGQAIPGGLHVRMNLETGVREAKLLEAEDTGARSVALVAETPTPTPAPTPVPTPAPDAQQHAGTDEDPEPVPREVMEQLESMELTLDDVAGLGVPDTSGVEPTQRGTLMDIMRASLALLGDRDIPTTPEEKVAHDARIAAMAERMAHLQDVDEIPLEFEASVVAKLIGRLRTAATSGDVDAQLDMLFELEDAVHKYDYGVDFVHQGGLDTVLDLLRAEHTSADVVRACVELLSAATGNNDKVAAQGARIVTVLLERMRGAVAAHNTALQYTLLPAVGKVLRGSADACAVLAHAEDGASPCMDALSQVYATMRAEGNFRGLTRWLVLAGDVLGASVVDSAELRALAQQHGWCDHIAALLTLPHDESEDEAAARARANMVRHTVQAMRECTGVCASAFRGQGEALRALRRQWNRELVFKQNVVLDGHPDDDGSIEMLDEDIAMVVHVLDAL